MRKMADRILSGRAVFATAILSNVIYFTSCVGAKNANAYFMRRNELSTGISVKHLETGQDFGKSKVAAKEALTQTMLSRTLYTVPIFFVPALWNFAIRRSRLNPKPGTISGRSIEFIGIVLGLAMAMPLNCALYPQTSQIDVEKLEPQI